jgi:hypothetical protein
VIDATLDRLRVAMTPLPMRGPRAFLRSEHDIHRLWDNRWGWIERAMKGGVHMQSLLRRFDWELENGDSITQRQRTASYINYPDLFATALAGHLTRSAPEPNYGSLGKVTGIDTPLAQQTRADLFHFNVDAQGGMGSGWNAWWNERMKSAAGYGFTWIMEESPGGASARRTGTAAQEFAGVRPYLVEWTPRSVWDWHYQEGALQYAIIRYHERTVRQTGDTFSANLSERFYLHVRKGWDNFGPEYINGGFWLYDDKNELVTTLNGTPVQGNYDSLGGEIPLHPLFFQRDTGTKEMPAIARSGVEELASMAEAYMNLSSARDFEVWDAAKGMEYFIGIDREAFKLAMEKVSEGSRFIPVPSTNQHPNPHVQDSAMSVVPAEVFKTALDTKRIEAEVASGMTQNAGPDASGLAREADFAAAKAPLLALFASELETCQTQAIVNIQKRWTGQGEGGGVVWPRKFELRKVAEEINSVFTSATLVGARSATLFTEGLVSQAKEGGLITTEVMEKTIRTELAANFQTDQQAAQALATMRAAPPTSRNLQVKDGKGNLVRQINSTTP